MARQEVGGISEERKEDQEDRYVWEVPGDTERKMGA